MGNGMANFDHLTLSTFIKSVHQDLRENAKLLGSDEAWEKHCKNELKLKKYASAMQELATYYWENSYKKKLKAISRVAWIHEYCQNYFHDDIKRQQKEREEEIAAKAKVDINLSNLQLNSGNNQIRLKLLDVGSCYNPFKDLNYEVTAIDIAPANADVLKCDFLNLQLNSNDVNELIINSNSTVITELPINSFDVVVFSLFLEYLPSPNQRHLCCVKAYDLLKLEGLLMIITPDSKHVGANAKIMKSWRFILANIGFSRVKYEKLPHMHCMAFRKSLSREISSRWAKLYKKEQVYEEIVIPQDFN